MAAIQVVNAVSNTAWTTDKVEIATTVANVTFQVSAVQLTYVQANGVVANATMTTDVGNLYANAVVVPGNSVQQYYVGAGNYLNIVTGTAFSATAIGTATSAVSSVKGVGAG
jgi:hypothetical protein